MIKISEYISRGLYFLVSTSLVLISIALMGVGLYGIWSALHDRTELVTALLDAIGFIVISMAVFDVSKYLMEEEVFKGRELASPKEARETLTKFMVIIAIAVSLEALVFIFDSAKKDITTLIYPTLLLVSAVFLIVGLGYYQKMSRHVEETTKS